MKNVFTYLCLVSFIFNGCKPKIGFEIKNFNPFINFESVHDTLSLSMDLSGAVTEGISIPSSRQGSNGYFKINFEILNEIKPCSKLLLQNFLSE